MPGLTNEFVETVGKKISGSFLGVYPCDIQPDIENLKYFSLIFNESKHDEDGSHFVAIFSTPNKIYYFDSLGLKLENSYISLFLHTTGRELVIKEKQIQSFDSIFCGIFCLCFIAYMEKGFNYTNFFEIFTAENLKLNDCVSTEFLLKLIKSVK